MFTPSEWKAGDGCVIAGNQTICEGLTDGNQLLILAAPHMYEFLRHVSHGDGCRADYARRLVAMADGTGPHVGLPYDGN